MLRAVGGSTWATDAGSAPAVALLLHGYGADEHDLLGLVPELGIAVPWASLRAPIDLGNGGAAWFVIGRRAIPTPRRSRPRRTRSGHGSTRTSRRARASCRSASRRAASWRPSCCGPARTGCSRRSCSPGSCSDAPQPADDRLAAERPAAFWGRGDADGVITAEAVARTAAFLPQHTSLVERVYPGLGHGIGAAEIEDVRAFLAAHLDAPADADR